MLTASRQVMESCRYGLSLCLDLILPSLFPFFLISGLLSRSGFAVWMGTGLSRFAERFLRVSGAGFTAFFIGLTGGYPMGAAYLSSLVQQGCLPKEEAEKLLLFCNNSGPAFLVGAIGVGCFGSVRIGLLLYAVHAFAALLTGLLLRGKPADKFSSRIETPSRPISFAAALTESVQQAVPALLTVCGFVVCFTVFTGLLDANGFLTGISGMTGDALSVPKELIRAVLIGFWELGGGVGALRGLSPTAPVLAAASALVGWGGISIHFQTLAVLSDADIKGALHTAGRLINAVLSFILTYGIFLLRN